MRSSSVSAFGSYLHSETYVSCVLHIQYFFCTTHKWWHMSVQDHSLIAVQESA